MKPKTKADIRKLHDTFLSLRINKPDAPAAIDHAPYEHLHEGADHLDELMTFCPLCHQDMLMRKIMAHIEADDA